MVKRASDLVPYPGEDPALFYARVWRTQAEEEDPGPPMGPPRSMPTNLPGMRARAVADAEATVIEKLAGDLEVVEPVPVEGKIQVEGFVVQVNKLAELERLPGEDWRLYNCRRQRVRQMRESREKRMQLLQVMREDPDLSNRELAERVGVDRTTVSHYFRALREEGLVSLAYLEERRLRARKLNALDHIERCEKLREERRQRILKLLGQHRSLTLMYVMASMKVAKATAAKDLKVLMERGLVVRFKASRVYRYRMLRKPEIDERRCIEAMGMSLEELSKLNMKGFYRLEIAAGQWEEIPEPVRKLLGISRPR